MNTPEIMDGPKDLWQYVGYEWEDGLFSKAVFVRAALRKGERDSVLESREKVADWLAENHPLDFYPVRVLYRACKRINDILFGAGKQRETTWVCGVILVACVVAVMVRMAR